MANGQSGEHGVVGGTDDTLDLTAFRRLPRDPEHRELLGVAVTDRLYALFMEELSNKEREALLAGKAPDSVRVKFDGLIIRQAGVLGWRVYLSPMVMTRVIQWYEFEDRGPELLRRLADEIVHGASVMRGQATFAITDPALYAGKQAMKEELRLLLKQYRQYKREFDRRRTCPTYEQMRNWFERTITESAGAFPRLHANLSWVMNYFECIKQRRDHTRAQRIALGYVKAGELFDAMFAFGANVSDEHGRQAISELGRLWKQRAASRPSQPTHPEKL